MSMIGLQEWTMMNMKKKSQKIKTAMQMSDNHGDDCMEK